MDTLDINLQIICDETATELSIIASHLIQV